MDAVVGAAGRDVDGDVADDPHAALGGIGAQRAPFALEAHLVGDGAAPANRSQSPIQYAWRSRKSAISDAETGARGSASRPRHAAKAELDL